MESVEIVNCMKLTKLEKKTLEAMMKSWRESFPLLHPERADLAKYQHNEGNSTAGIAVLVYGIDALSRLDGQILVPSIKCSMSRTLNNLSKKGLVHRCTPDYRSRWVKADDNDMCYMSRSLQHLETSDGEIIPVPRFTSLPTGTKVWWMITDKGTRIAEETSGIIPRRERCSQCFHGLNKNDECQHQIGRDYHTAVENPLEIDECEYFKDKDRWGWNEWSGELELWGDT